MLNKCKDKTKTRSSTAPYAGALLCLFTLCLACPFKTVRAETLELHGMQLGMSFKAAHTLLKNKWPKADITPKYNTINHAGGSYRYGESIDVSNGPEIIKLRFAPPASIRNPEGSARLKQIEIRQRETKSPEVANEPEQKLTRQYGPATLQGENRLTWLFDDKNRPIEKAAFKNEADTKRRACTNIRQRQKNMLRISAASEQPTPEHKKILTTIAKQLAACETALAEFLSCQKRESNRLCPYILTVTKNGRGGNGDDFKGVSTELLSARLQKLAEKNTRALKAQLQNQAKRKTTVKPKPKPKPEPQAEKPTEQPLPDALINF